MNIENNKKIIGRLEYISFPDFGIKDIVAKVDTGAYSGSVHAVSIEEVKNIENKSLLKFKLIGEPHAEYENVVCSTTNFYKKKVRSSNGLVEYRYIVKCNFILGVDVYVGEFSLSDRSDMRRPVLLGRKIIKNNFLVDVSKTFLLKK